MRDRLKPHRSLAMHARRAVCYFCLACLTLSISTPPSATPAPTPTTTFPATPHCCANGCCPIHAPAAGLSRRDTFEKPIQINEVGDGPDRSKRARTEEAEESEAAGEDWERQARTRQAL